jgi:hypothetical protein
MVELRHCPFCGESKHIGVHVVSEVFIDIYPDEEADQTAKALQVTAVCQCRNCYAQVEDWARLLVPHALYAEADASAPATGEYRKFVGEAHEKAQEMARRAWNHRV